MSVIASLSDLFDGEKNPNYSGTLTRNIKITKKCKPHLSQEKIMLHQEYPGYINMIDACETQEDINFIRKDLDISRNLYSIIAKKIDAVNTFGDSKETHIFYKKIKHFIDAGITSKMAENTQQYFNVYVRNYLNDKAKEIRNNK